MGALRAGFLFEESQPITIYKSRITSTFQMACQHPRQEETRKEGLTCSIVLKRLILPEL